MDVETARELIFLMTKIRKLEIRLEEVEANYVRWEKLNDA